MSRLAITKAWTTILLANPIGWVALAIIAIAGAFVTAYRTSETIRTSVRAVGDAGIWMWENALKPAVDGIPVVVQAVAGLVM